MMPQDDRVYVFDVKEVETKELKEKRSKATQNSISIFAERGEYSATDYKNGSLHVSWQKKISRTVNAHGWFICAIAFHQTLPLLATYCGLKEEKKLKIWYIPSGLSSDPVLVSSFHIPEGTVLSVTFHPTLPLIFCGKDNGDIEVWRAV
jgi:WD40 repeat protein